MDNLASLQQKEFVEEVRVYPLFDAENSTSLLQINAVQLPQFVLNTELSPGNCRFGVPLAKGPHAVLLSVPDQEAVFEMGGADDTEENALKALFEYCLAQNYGYILADKDAPEHPFFPSVSNGIIRF